jgi:hypothetical protein
VNVAFHAQLASGPGIEGNPGLEIFHLKPVFDVDGDEEMVQVVHAGM